MTVDDGILFRPMEKEDLDRVLEIENTSFSDPWPREAFLEELKNPFAFQFVMVRNGRLAGYSMSWVVLDEGHLMNIAVAPDFRGLGLGRLLLKFTLEQIAARGARVVFLEVRITNQPALNLYRSAGFQALMTRKGYYSDGTDAVVMKKEVSHEDADVRKS